MKEPIVEWPPLCQLREGQGMGHWLFRTRSGELRVEIYFRESTDGVWQEWIGEPFENWCEIEGVDPAVMALLVESLEE